MRNIETDRHSLPMNHTNSFNYRKKRNNVNLNFLNSFMQINSYK